MAPAEHKPLNEAELPSKDPIKFFEIWYDEAKKSLSCKEAHVMNVATASKDGKPSCRVISIGSVIGDKLTFHADFESKKGKDLAENPHIAASIYWPTQDRGVRVEGTVEKLSDHEANEAWKDIPVELKTVLFACKPESEPVKSREFLVDAVAEVNRNYTQEGLEIPIPPHSGTYAITPTTVEFIQGHADFIADRIRFRRPREGEDENLVHTGENGWVYERLAP